MYTKDFCNNLIEKLANMEMGQQQASAQPGSGGLVPGYEQDAGAGGAPAGPKVPKVKPEQLYERMLKMAGRMADMSAQPQDPAHLLLTKNLPHGPFVVVGC